MKSVGKNLLSGFLLLSSLTQVPHAHADVIYDLPNLEEGELPPVPQPQASAPATPTAPSAPTNPAQPTAPTAKSAAAAAALKEYLLGWTAFDKISQRPNGDLFIVELKNAMPLKQLKIDIAGRARILTTTLITVQGRRIGVREFTRTGILESGSSHLSENLNLYDPVKTIEVRMQSYPSTAMAEAMAKFTTISDAGKPDLTFTRAEPSAPAVVKTTPAKQPAPRDTTLREGNKVLSNNMYPGILIAEPFAGNVMVRDNRDYQLYTRPVSEVAKEVSTDTTGRYYRGVKVLMWKKIAGIISHVYANDMVMVKNDHDGKESAHMTTNLVIRSQ